MHLHQFPIYLLQLCIIFQQVTEDMRLNADYNQKVIVKTNDIQWIPSPTPGVDRRMCDRVGDEVARATSRVRYGPNSKFPFHKHPGGEEFFVLSGVFIDEEGSYPAGTYCRHPIDSSHSPWTDNGCELLVKLYFMKDTTETKSTVVLTDCYSPSPKTSSPTSESVPSWESNSRGSMLKLFSNEGTSEHVWMEKWVAGAQVDFELRKGGTEIYVLAGEVDEGGDVNVTFTEGTWARYPPSDAGKKTKFNVKKDVCLYIKSGHLTPFIDN
eukprot:TRINITY_DN8002_c0_g1_i1.p1 TRINITY_DN8002_c0_g1~~TRINITY_DN8002_c0_g1_i1.p1  ORF type:complete len:268 (+),score=47.03 TRINITY_DN8002_c0_g1_i1:27-830(+)